MTAQQTYTNVCKKLWAYFGGEAPASVVPADEDLALGVFAGLYREGFRLAGKRVHILGAGSFADALAACLKNGGHRGGGAPGGVYAGTRGVFCRRVVPQLPFQRGRVRVRLRREMQHLRSVVLFLVVRVVRDSLPRL